MRPRWPMLLLLVAACDKRPPDCAEAAPASAERPREIPNAMPIAPVTLRPWGSASPHRFQVDEATLLQAMILGQEGGLPLAPTEKRRRVLAAEQGSLIALAGLRVGDEIVALAGTPVDDDELLSNAFRRWRSDGRLTLALLRNGERLELEYTREGPPSPQPSRESGEEEEGALSEIRDLGGGTFELSQAAADRLFSDQSAWVRGARIIPHQENGVVVGLRILGIRPKSAHARLGLENGDVVKTVGGFDVSAPSKALDAYAKLRGATEVRVEIERRGAPLTLTYRIVK